jgi:DNA-binding NtrC family response regulator
MMDQKQNSKITVFILDMEHNSRELVRRWMSSEGYRTLAFQDATSCLDAMTTDTPDILLADVLTASLAGLEIVDKVTRVSPDTLVILFYQPRLKDNALKSVYRGAYDFHPKPVDRVRLTLSVKNASKQKFLEETNSRLRNDHLLRRRRSSMPPGAEWGISMKDLERRAIKDALAASGGNVSKAARTLGLGRTTMYRKMSAFGIGSFRTGGAANPPPSETDTTH